MTTHQHRWNNSHQRRWKWTRLRLSLSNSDRCSSTNLCQRVRSIKRKPTLTAFLTVAWISRLVGKWIPSLSTHLICLTMRDWTQTGQVNLSILLVILATLRMLMLSVTILVVLLQALTITMENLVMVISRIKTMAIIIAITIIMVIRQGWRGTKHNDDNTFILMIYRYLQNCLCRQSFLSVWALYTCFLFRHFISLC